MKNMRRIASFLLALVMVLSLTTTAFAATITIAADADSPTAGHTYKVYQIFTGTLNGTTLSDIKYGTNYTPGNATTGTLVPETELKAITDANDARAFADDLMNTADENTVDIEGTAVATLSGENLTATVPDGYYLIVDEGGADMDKNDTLSAYMVEVVDTITINPKSETTDSNKEIVEDDYADNLEADDSTVKDANAIGDQNLTANNGAIGTVVTFEIKAEVPANATGYNYYYLVLNDTLSKGLTLNENSIEVYQSDDGTLDKESDEKLDAKTTDAVNDYVVYVAEPDANGNTKFQVAMTHAKDYANSTVIVRYTATINEDVVIGPSGELNKFVPQFSRDPNFEYDDKTTDYLPDNDELTAIGEGPEKSTRTYSTGILIRKVDQNRQPLTGAEFTLNGTSLNQTLVSEEVFVVDDNGEYYKLNTTPATYTKEAPTETAMVEKTDRDSGYIELAEGDPRDGQVTVNGKTYGPASTEELAGDAQLYTYVEGNTDDYVAPDASGKYTMYKKTLKLTTETKSAENNIVQAVDTDGYAYFMGLGEGSYTIKETVTPDGYNTMADKTLVIDWTADTTDTDTDCEWTAKLDGGAVTGKEMEIEVPVYGEDGTTVTGSEMKKVVVFDIEIVNKPGSNLPETGGMGTTLFYVFGGIMVLAAVVLLVTKKRMGAAE